MNRTDTFQSTPHETILEEAQRLIFGDRRLDYGHPLDDYTRTAGMVNAAFSDVLKRPLTPEDVMMIMIMVKLSRFRQVPKRDSLVDGAGYFGCIAEAMEERDRRTKVIEDSLAQFNPKPREVSEV